MAEPAETVVWIRDKNDAWVSATVVEKRKTFPDDEEKEDTTFVLRKESDGSTVEIESKSSSVAHNNDMKLRNVFDDGTMNLSQVKDLTKLTHLHEPAILEALCVRFQKDLIYTYTGPILLAVNPFKQLKLYTPQILEMYYTTGLLKSQGLESPALDPHVYAIGDNAYRSLQDSGDASGQNKKNQSILVSGESGAGKTESTKFIMRYLATIAGAKANPLGDKTEKEGAHAIADKVLQSNPILEAFGNARTIRNDNSSRFGKFIEMQFDAAGVLQGAKIATYLLEKVRLAHQGPDERNFHIFYQIFGAPSEDLERWKVPQKETCRYINQSGCYERKDGVNDDDQYKKMIQAMEIMDITPEERENVFVLTSAVMNLAGMDFQNKGDEGCEIIKEGLSGDSLSNLSSLLQLEEDELQKGLCTRQIQVGLEWFNKGLTSDEAHEARDAVAKDIYSRLFNWLVRRVNHSIEHVSKIRSFIGVLDIFGFEVFEQNSFEQLCINYANETLQQQFNQFVFKLEQLEYEKEGIKWSFIDFPDNQACLDLIEGKPVGLLSLLDEQCLFPQGNDESLASKLYENLGDKERFSASRPHKVNFQFVIEHYAGDVCYDTAGFCNKNKDQLRQELLDLLRSSPHELVKTLYPAETVAGSSSNSPSKGSPSKRSSIRLVSVGTQFKTQLSLLLATIRETSPHYIRCLKPNDQNVPDVKDRPRLVDQLRYGGVLEAVKVARAGYPTRPPLQKFVERYFMLVPGMSVKAGQEGDGKAACKEIVKALGVDGEEHSQIGRTKVFLRKNAYETIEAQRGLCMRAAATKVQALGRMHIQQREYSNLKSKAIYVQSWYRGRLAVAVATKIRHAKAILRIQTMARAVKAKHEYHLIQKAARFGQKYTRGRIARNKVNNIRREAAAIVIQGAVRRTEVRRKQWRLFNAASMLQRLVRSKRARQQLKQLRIEAREVGSLQKNITALKARVQELEFELENERKLRSEVESKLHGGDAVDDVVASDMNDSSPPQPNAVSPPVVASESNSITNTSDMEKMIQSLEAKLAMRDAEVQDLEASQTKLLQEVEKLRTSESPWSPSQGTSDESKSEFDPDSPARAVPNPVESRARAASSKAVETLEDEVRELRDELAKSQKLAAKLALMSENETSAIAAAAEGTASSAKVEELEKEMEVVKEAMNAADVQRSDAVREADELRNKVTELENAVETLQEQLTSNVEQMCDSENRAMDSHNELVKTKGEMENLKDKIAAMEQLAEQASGVKIILGRRLEQLIQENRILRQSKTDLEDKLDYYMETNKLLTTDYKELKKKLHEQAAKAHLI